MKQNTPSLQIGIFVSLAFLLLAFVAPVLAQAQDEYLPVDDLDLEQVAQMLDRVEYYARECSQYRCPKLDCKRAKDLYEQIYWLRRISQLYAFWISKIPGFPELGRTGERYKKVTALYRRLDALLASRNDPKSGAYSFASCVSKLSAACGTVEPNPEELNSVFVSVNGSLRRVSRRREDYEQVTFSSSGEPSEGTASYPGKWRKGLGETLAWLMKASRSLASFPAPEQAGVWVKLDRKTFLSTEKINVRYSSTNCCSDVLTLAVVQGDRTISSYSLRPDRADRSKFYYDGSSYFTTLVDTPNLPGEYELRIFDPDFPWEFSYTGFDVLQPAPGFSLVGRWRTNDGLEVVINPDGDRFVGIITELGKINESQNLLKFKLGQVLWKIVVTDVTDDGRAIYTFFSPPDFQWGDTGIPLESENSFVIPWTSFHISPKQGEGFVRLWRVRHKPKTDLSTKPVVNEQNN